MGEARKEALSSCARLLRGVGVVMRVVCTDRTHFLWCVSPSCWSMCERLSGVRGALFGFNRSTFCAASVTELVLLPRTPKKRGCPWACGGECGVGGGHRAVYFCRG